jgi:Zn-finger nucleic acid-binding protein
MMFIGSKHCQRCGAAAAIPKQTGSPQRDCPRCRLEMSSLTIGSTPVRECEQCLGLWLDVASFEKLCVDREQQSVVLGTASLAPTSAVQQRKKESYVPCPECLQLMNRINFARCSGVIVDICKGHGTWFDRDELSRIVEFIRGGGLEASRAREKEEIKEERRRLWEEQATTDRNLSRLGLKLDNEHRLTGIASARGLLKFLLD